MFDGMSFKKIKKAKIGGESFRDKLTAIWFELMDFAGRCNQDGAFISPREIPFTELSDIATMIDREEEELQLCMGFYLKEGMVTITDDVYSIANWTEYQNTEGLEKIREQNRIRQAKFKERKKQPLLCDNVIDNVTVTLGNALDKEEDKEERKKNKKKDNKELFASLREDYILHPMVEEKVIEWLEYKNERKDFYVERGMKSFLREIENNELTYGDEALCKVIDFSMSNQYKGIIFDKLKENKPQPKQSGYVDSIQNRMSVVDEW